MKRTKTFVTKFLSVLAVGAIVLSSCTKDLEDRLDKVEETLNIVVKDVADLQKALEDLDVKVSSIKGEGTTVVGAQDAVTGLITLTFTNPDKVITFNGVGSSTIPTPTPPDGNDAAEVIVTEDAVNNTTTVRIKQPNGTFKEFTYPTTITNITNVSGIVIGAKLESITQVGLDDFMYITLNTNSSDQIALNANNLFITNAYATKASIFEKTENLTIMEVTPVTGALNEFKVRVRGALESNAEYRIGVKQEVNNIMSQDIFACEVEAFSSIDAIEVAGINVSNNTNTTGIEAVVDNSTTVFSKELPVEFSNNFNNTSTNVTYRTSGYSVVCYRMKTATTVADAITKSGLGATQLLSAAADAAVITEYDENLAALAINTTAAERYNGITAPAVAENALPLAFTLPAFDATKVGTQYYVVSLSGKCDVDNKVIRSTFVIQVDIKNNKHYTVTAGKVGLTADDMNYTVADALGKNYSIETGNSKVEANNLSAKLYDAKGVQITNGTISAVPAGTDGIGGDGRMTYKVTLPKALAAGVYSVVVTDNYDAKNSNLVITQEITIVEPTVTFTAKSAAGYAAGVYDSFSQTIVKDYTYASAFTTTVANATGILNVNAVAGHKIYYRLNIGGGKYLDGYTTDLSAYTYAGTAAAKVVADMTEVPGSALAAGESVARIAYNKSYPVDAYIVLENGQIIKKSTGITVKYMTLDPITGFVQDINQKVSATREFAIAVDGTETFDVSYIIGQAKPMFFTNTAGTKLYLTEADSKVLPESVKAIKNSTLEYKVEEIPYSEEYFTAAIGQTPTEADKFTFVEFTGTNSKLAATAAEIVGTTPVMIKYTLAGATTKISGIKKAITQVVTVTGKDVWERPFTLKINVTVSPKVK